jgi:hypothetical protein
MGAETEGTGSGQLVEVRRAIERWRRGRVGRARMPAELWEQAVSLAEVEGAYAVARKLGIDYSTLRARLERRIAVDRGERRQAAGFVEVGLIGAGGRVSSVVELSRADGARLRVELDAGQRLDVAALAEVFCRRGR